MLVFEDNARLWLAGDNGAPMAYVEASAFANEGHHGYGALTADIASAFRDVLGIAPERVYVRYEDIPVWSVGDMVVDRRMFRGGGDGARQGDHRPVHRPDDGAVVGMRTGASVNVAHFFFLSRFVSPAVN